MTKSDIVNAVMSFNRVRNVEIDDVLSGTGMVTITVTTDYLQREDIYDLRTRIMERLEPDRPVGVGLEIVMKRFDDDTTVYFGRRVEMMYSATQAMEAFGSRSSDYEKVVDTFNSKPIRRSRFAAVAEELTEHIAPVKKPSPNAIPKLNAPRLFEETIEVKNRKPAPCPRCGCQAFTPNVEDSGRTICRGCPLPAPVFAVEFIDDEGLDTSVYKCCSCGRTSSVTMSMSQINFYCGGCNKLALHDLREDPKKKKTKFFSGSKIFMLNGVKAEGFADAVEYEPIGAMDMYKDFVPGKGYTATLTMKTEGPSDWMETIEKLALKASAEYGMTYEQLAGKYVEEREAMNASPAAQLMELFRQKLDLLPFNMYETQQRNENILREGRGLRADGSDRDRRTGRTTRGLVRAIAEYLVSDLKFLYVVGHTERYTKDLLNLAREMIMKINVTRRIDLKPIMPGDFDMRYDTRTQRGARLVYVDHSYEEKLARYR